MAIFTRKSIASCLVSQRGLSHVRNEDHGYQNDNRQVYAVADGIGGLPGGDKASEIAIDHFIDEIRKLKSLGSPWDSERMNAIFLNINQAVLDYCNRYPDYRGMGTTFSGLIAENENRWWLLHAGDSRVYGIEPSGVKQLTTDQTLSTERQQMGLPIDSGNERSMHVLTNYVGTPFFKPTVELINPRLYHSFILCTDGLCKKMNPEMMKNGLRNTSALEENCQTLVRLAQKAGSTDDITVIIVRRGANA